VLREVRQNLPERSAREKRLPWDSASIINSTELPPERSSDLELACARDAVAFTIRLAGINVTARSPNVGNWCGVGRQPNDNGLIGGYRTTENATRKLRRSVGVSEPHDHLQTIVRQIGKWLARTARGHAAKEFLTNSATGRDAMSLSRTVREPQ
jgi:hypothetical protein